MPQSLSKIAIHLIFSTKNRQRVLVYPDLRNELEAYIIGILCNLKSPSIMTRAETDHAHILYFQNRTASTAEIAGTVKKESSAWIKTKKPELRDPNLIKFAWQAGYGAFSVSESKIEAVKSYIENQEEHHKRVTFQEEYREFLLRHRIEYDKRYVWD